MNKINLQSAFSQFADHWSPKIVGDINNCHIKLVKLKGRFEWHHHDEEDELFLVIAGRMRMDLRDGPIDLDPGEFIIVPRGVEHCPEALTEECSVLLLEPKSTLNTGNVISDRTVAELQRLVP